MQAHSLSLHTHTRPWGGVEGKYIFSESSHVEYQINGNGAQSTM